MRGSEGQQVKAKKLRYKAPGSEGEPRTTSTFAEQGRLDAGSTPFCTRCGDRFKPKAETIRRHNRKELTQLLCPPCTERNDRLMCASIRLMIVRGGLPLSVDHLVQAFEERDEALAKSMEDPLEEVRSMYIDDPLTENDIFDWVEAGYFVMNPITRQVECMINVVMNDPERVKMLGKEGLAGRDMAAKKMQILEKDKKSRGSSKEDSAIYSGALGQGSKEGEGTSKSRSSRDEHRHRAASARAQRREGNLRQTNV